LSNVLDSLQIVFRFVIGNFSFLQVVSNCQAKRKVELIFKNKRRQNGVKKTYASSHAFPSPYAQGTFGETCRWSPPGHPLDPPLLQQKTCDFCVGLLRYLCFFAPMIDNGKPAILSCGSLVYRS